MSKYPSQNQDKFTVRFPDGMRDELAKIAEENGRSMNSEIVQVLQEYIDRRKANIAFNLEDIAIASRIALPPTGKKYTNIPQDVLDAVSSDIHVAVLDALAKVFANKKD
ncbi:TPA: Arc family DNA-binding protein [Providencia stuartii]